MTIASSKTSPAAWRRWVYDKIGIADNLTTATGVVEVASSTAPTAGQSLVATSATVATWQDIAPEMVFASAYEYSNHQTINLTTERVEYTLTIDIPSHWVTYDIMTNWTAQVDELTAAAGDALIDVHQRFDNTSGQILGRTRGRLFNSATNGPTEMPFAIAGVAKAETTTGTRTIVISADSNADDEDYRFLYCTWWAVAVRTS